MRRRIIVSVASILLLAVFAFAAYNVVLELMSYKKIDETYSELQKQFVSTLPSSETTDSDPQSDVNDTESNESDSVSSAEKTENPSPSGGISVDFKGLQKLNPQIVGWIYGEGTPISYPVAQADDNLKYLRSDIYGNYLISGTIFADYRNKAPGEDKNYILYGHNMNNSSMFGTILKYSEQEYYEAHPSMQLLTPSGAYTIQLVAGLIVDRSDIIYTPNPSEADFEAFLAKAISSSTFDSGLEFEAEDKLITLSTCSENTGDNRYILIGKLIKQ